MAQLALQPQAQAATGALDADGDGRYDALTDGTLVLRYLFGLRGNTLINGAVGPGAQRRTAAEIIGWLDQRRAAFDVDADGKVDALTDGVMILRYMFGLRGPALVNGAIGNGAGRGTAAQIEGYIATLMP